MPTSITLKVLHDIVQITMGWLDQHLWKFTIGKQKHGLSMDPPFRRKVAKPTTVVTG